MAGPLGEVRRPRPTQSPTRPALWEIVQKFRSKYGLDQIKRYYSKLDVAVEVSVPA